MKKIIIDPHYCSREELAELKKYLTDNSWDWKEEEDAKAEEVEKFTLGDDSINGITINEKIIQEELFEYRIVHKESFEEDLCRWISECKNSDKQLMKDDLKLLTAIEDEYIFSSISTNDYIYQGHPDFEKTCTELLELNTNIR